MIFKYTALACSLAIALALTACGNDDKATPPQTMPRLPRAIRHSRSLLLGRLPMLTLAHQALFISVWVLVKPW